MALKVSLSRSDMRGFGLDITVKSSTGWSRAFAPTWDMVMGHKAGQISDEEYIAAYTQILDQVSTPAWQTLYDEGLIWGCNLCLKCYCPDGKFCHTHLLIDYAVEKWPDVFTDGRPRPEQESD